MSVLGVLLVVLAVVDASDMRVKRSYHNSKLEIKNGDVDLIVNGDTVQFFALGDWGGLPVFPYRTIVEQAVSYQMTKWAQEYNTHFQLTLGDNFYFNGVKDVNDKRFKHTFENVFIGEYLDTPWFMALGNHDWYGNTTAQIEYTKYSKKWVLPDFNYVINIKTNSGRTHIASILVIDTVQLCGNSSQTEHSQPEFSTEHGHLKANGFLELIENKLKNVAALKIPYILVAGHYPVWSVSSHGPTECLVDKIRPLLHKYAVNAYFCGHDHNLQHISDTYMNVSVEHIVSGAGALNDNSTKHIDDLPNQNSLKFFWGLPEIEFLHGGLAIVSLTSTNATVRFMETDGKGLYQTVLYPRSTRIQ